MIDQITANHFVYENKLYYTQAKTLAGFYKRKTIRNLLSRSRLLDDSEASAVKPKLSRVCVMYVDGELLFKETTKLDAFMKSKIALGHNVHLVVQTKKIGKVTAQRYVAQESVLAILEDLPIHFIDRILIEPA